jgi:serine/threonine protein kinase
LDEWREGAEVSVSAIQGVIEQLLRAVAAAHAAGVVHRDLKPGNVLVVQGGWKDPLARGAPLVKVLDFGVAKWLHSATAIHTREGLGTPSWTAPEQGQVGHRPALNADVWSLGLMVFWLLTGRQYWLAAGEGGSIAELALELMRRPIVPASERAQVLGVSDLLPAGFDSWFARCVCREPDRRFADAGSALDSLGRILGLHTRQPRWWDFWRRGQRRRTGDR